MSSAPPAETAFERDVLPHMDLMYRVALHLTGEPAAAEDLVQDTVLKAFRAWDSFRQGTNARGWLLTILRNTFINDYRRRRRAPAQVNLEVAEQHARLDDQPGQDPEGDFFHSLVDDRILAAIDGLPEEFREVVVLAKRGEDSDTPDCGDARRAGGHGEVAPLTARKLRTLREAPSRRESSARKDA
jgi:RNA polymerase sigma-70 factor (ECF subfamily)